MKDLKTTTALVKWLLEVEPQTRNSDSYLYLKVLEHVSLEKGIKLDFLTVRQFLSSMNILGLPAFETVRRTRQKLQQTFPELGATKAIEQKRTEKQREFLEYARGEI